MILPLTFILVYEHHKNIHSFKKFIFWGHYSCKYNTEEESQNESETKKLSHFLTWTLQCVFSRVRNNIVNFYSARTGFHYPTSCMQLKASLNSTVFQVCILLNLSEKS